VEFYEKSGEQFEKKESIYKDEIKELKEKLVLDSKDLKKKYEDQISKLQSELFSVKDTLTEYQNVIDAQIRKSTRKQNCIYSTCKDFEDKNKTFTQLLEEKEALIKDYEIKLATSKSVPLDVEESMKLS
jgi:predicted  nucleic acid-binding Zn-ribbon protein